MGSDIDDLLAENSGTEPEAFPVPLDEPTEGPSNLAQPPPPAPGVPGPDMQAAADDFVPPVPAEAPGNVGAPVPLPGAEAPSAGGEDKPLAIAKAEGEQDKAAAKVDAERAQKESDLARENAEDAKLAYADYQERRAAAQSKLDEKTSAFEKQKLTDPRENVTAKERLSVIFGGLGSAFRSAGGGDATNHALTQLQKKWDDNLDLQKSKIAAAKDQVVMARAGVNDVDEARHELTTAANAKTIAQYNAAIKQGEAQLKNLGMNAAEISADKRIQALQVARAAHVVQAQKEADAHALNAAKIEALKAKASRDARKAKGAGGGGSGGGGGAGGTIALADEIQKRAAAGNPMTATEELAAAKHYGVPEVAKAGHSSLKTVKDDIEKNRKTEETEGKTAFHDENGKLAGHVPGGRGGAQAFATRDTDYGRAQHQLEQLLEHIEKEGDRPSSHAEQERRASLYNNAVGGVATVSPMGKNLESVEIEKAALGPSGALIGHGGGIMSTLRGANADNVRRKIEEIKKARADYRTHTLVPLAPGEAEADARKAAASAPKAEPAAKSEAKAAPEKAPDKVAPSDDALLAEAKQIVAAPAGYSQKAIQRARAYLGKRLAQ